MLRESGVQNYRPVFEASFYLWLQLVTGTLEKELKEIIRQRDEIVRDKISLSRQLQD